MTALFYRSKEERTKLLTQVLHPTKLTINKQPEPCINSLTWSITQVRANWCTSSYIPSPVAEDKSLGKDVAKRLLYLTNLELAQPIDQILFGIHKKGVVSIIVVLRVGNTEYVKSQLRSLEYYFTNSTEKSADHRPRITFSSSYNTPEEQARTHNFLQDINRLAPFGPSLEAHLQELLAYADKLNHYYSSLPADSLDTYLSDYNFSIPSLKYIETEVSNDDSFYSAVASCTPFSMGTLRNKVADFLVNHLDELRARVDLRHSKTIENHIERIREEKYADPLDIEIMMRVLGRPIYLLGYSSTIENKNITELRQTYGLTGEPLFFWFSGYSLYRALLPTGQFSTQQILSYLQEYEKLEHWRPTLNVPFTKENITFLNSANTVVLQFGGTEHITPCSESISEELLSLYQAIFAEDIVTAQLIIASKPHLMFERGPAFFNAIDLALDIGSPTLRKILYIAWKAIPRTPYNQNSFNRLYLATLSAKDEVLAIAVEDRAAKVLKYQESLVNPPQRHPIHTAAIAGDLELIEQLLASEPALLESQDVLGGHTILMLATFYGHTKLAKWLITQRQASLATIEIERYDRSYHYNPVDYPQTAKMYRLYFHYGNKSLYIKDYLNHFIATGNYLAVETFLNFDTELKIKQGLDPLNRLLASPEGDPQTKGKILKLLLEFRKTPVQSGHKINALEQEQYDSTIPENLQVLLCKHNERLRTQRPVACIAQQQTSKDGRKWLTSLSSPHGNLASIILPTTDLSLFDIQQIYQRYREDFSSTGFSLTALKKALEFIISFILYNTIGVSVSSPHKISNIELIYNTEKQLASFFTTHTTKGVQPSGEKAGQPLTVFHCDVVSVNPKYDGLGLALLILRLAAALKLLTKGPLYIVIKALRPGNATGLTLDSDYYPKYTADLELMKYIFNLVGEPLSTEHHTVPAQLRVNREPKPNPPPALREFNNMMEDAPDDTAMPICFKFTKELLGKFFQKAKAHGITPENVMDLADHLPDLINNQNPKFMAKL